MRFTVLRRTWVKRSLLIAAVVFAVGIAVWLVLGGDAKEPPNQWPQAHVDVRADPAVLFGQLPNGMRYAIKRNEKPANAVSIRLRIGSGSLVEKKGEQGIAHFLEHMAFRGSTNYPDGQVFKVVARLGLRSGADANAFTSQEDTVYQFDLPVSDDASLSTGFGIFRDIGSNLRLDQRAIDTERGVVLAEERVSSSPSGDVWNAAQAFILEGQAAGGHEPIGTIPTLTAITREQLLAFYRANYQPQNATLIVVGAVNPEQVEALIKDWFSDWSNTGPVPTFDLGKVMPRGLTVRSFQRDGATESITLNWVRASAPRPLSRQMEREGIVRSALISVINERLYDLSRRPATPLISAQAAYQNETKSADNFVVSIEPVAGRRDEALRQVVRLVRATCELGVSEAELTRAKEAVTSAAYSAVDTKETRLNADIAQEITDTVQQGRVFASPEYAVSETQVAMWGLDLERAKAGLRKFLVGHGPLVFHAGPKMADDDAQSLNAQMVRLLSEPVTPYVPEALIPWPYEQFGKGGRVTRLERDSDLGVTIVEFANGTRLAIKPTKFEANRAKVTVRFGEGSLSLTPWQTYALWDINMLVTGGTRKLTQAQFEKSAGTASLSVEVSADPHAFVLEGETQSDDMLVQLQALAAYYSDAGFRTETYRADLASAKGQIAARQADPQAVSDDEFSYLAHGRNPRWRPVRDPAALDAFSPSDFATIMRPQMAGPVDIAIVGDVDVDSTIKEVAVTFGALATQLKTRAPLVYPRMAMVPGRQQSYVFHHKGRPDQAMLTLAWGTDWYFDMGRDTFSLTIAQRILQSRLKELVRNKFGLGYSLWVDLEVSSDYRGHGYLSASLGLPKDKFPVFRQLVLEQIHDMAVNGVSADEFQRAQRPELEGRRKALETNAMWVPWVGGLLSDPDHTRTLIANYVKGYEAVTAADVGDVMRRRIDGRVPLTVEVVPDVPHKGLLH